VNALGADIDLEPQDGRHARRDRNKIAVVDAYLELIREGNPRPSVAEVADRSGVSHRSVFRYFADRDELARTSIERQESFVTPLLSLPIDHEQPLRDRVDLVVKRRLELFEAIAPVARLSRSLAPMQPIIQSELTKARAFFRAQVKRLFAPELTAMDKAHAASVVAVLDVLCSFEVAELLRTDQGLSTERTGDALRAAMIALLG
jgi:AcrR family transcriptional regulator